MLTAPQLLQSKRCLGNDNPLLLLDHDFRNEGRHHSSNSTPGDIRILDRVEGNSVPGTTGLQTSDVGQPSCQPHVRNPCICRSRRMFHSRVLRRRSATTNIPLLDLLHNSLFILLCGCTGTASGHRLTLLDETPLQILAISPTALACKSFCMDTVPCKVCTMKVAVTDGL